jgi:hypothetical protein
MIWLPRPVFFKERVGENDELAHDRGEGGLWLFAGGDETAVEQFERWVEAGRGDGGHVQGFAHMSAPASDMTRAIVLATVASDRPAISAIAATGPTPGIEERTSRRLARTQSPAIRRLISMSRLAIAISTALSWRLSSRISRLALLVPSWLRNGGSRADGGIAAVHEFLQGLDEAGRRRGDAGAKALAQDREHARVDGIGLGQGADGLGKQPRTQRIDDGDREAAGAEIAVSLAVKLARRLHDDKRDFIGGQRFFQSFEAGRIIADGELLANRMDKDVKPSFTDVDSGVDLRCRASF